MIRLHMLGYAMVIGIITHLNIIVIHIMMVTESDGMIMFECETMMVQKRWSMQITKERTLQSHTMNQAIEHTIITTPPNGWRACDTTVYSNYSDYTQISYNHMYRDYQSSYQLVFVSGQGNYYLITFASGATYQTPWF